MFKNAKTECEGFGEEVLILSVWVHREWNHTAFSKQQGWCENARSRRDREHKHQEGHRYAHPMGTACIYLRIEWMKARITTEIFSDFDFTH